MKQQRGGTILGFVIGVVVGLGVALAVAVYVTKVPIPFIDRGQTRSADQDVVESQKNKNWDPNAALAGKNPAKPAATMPGLGGESLPADGGASVALPKGELKPAVTADPLGDLVNARANADTAEPFRYFVQVGAFRSSEDAESQRAKLSLSGVEAKVSEREQAGRTVFRVRVGPFERRGEADQAKEKLDAAGLETALVRVQR